MAYKRKTTRCVICGKRFERHGIKKCCSKECSSINKKNVQREYRERKKREKVVVNTCMWCGKEFTATRTLLTCSKECEKNLKNERDRIRHKKRRMAIFEGKPSIIRRNHTGKLYVYDGHKKVLYWTPQMINILERHFSTSTTKEVCEMLGLSATTVRKKAKQLGLKKDEKIIEERRRRNVMVASALNRKRGNRGFFKKGNMIWKKAIVARQNKQKNLQQNMA